MPLTQHGPRQTHTPTDTHAPRPCTLSPPLLLCIPRYLSLLVFSLAGSLSLESYADAAPPGFLLLLPWRLPLPLASPRVAPARPPSPSPLFLPASCALTLGRLPCPSRLRWPCRLPPPPKNRRWMGTPPGCRPVRSCALHGRCWPCRRRAPGWARHPPWPGCDVHAAPFPSLSCSSNNYRSRSGMHRCG